MSPVPSLDPRINRLDFKKIEDGEEHTNSHLETFEVFHQEKRGAQVLHVGIVHASSPEMALIMAKEVFGRRGKTTAIWVVRTSDVFTFGSAEEDIFSSAPDKFYREAAAYKVRDKIEAFRQKNKS